MGIHRISVSVNSPQKFKKAIDFLQNYETELDSKIRTALDILTKEGVEIAYERTNLIYPGMVMYFSMEHSEPYNYLFLVVGKDTQRIINQWVNKEGKQEREISPLLMAEFGSGHFAENPLGVAGVGRGTYPPDGHGNQSIWFWKETDDSGWSSSMGIEPTQPMYTSRNQMMQLAVSVFNGVFSQ